MSRAQAHLPRLRFHSIECAIEKAYTRVGTRSHTTTGRCTSTYFACCKEWTRTQSLEAIEPPHLFLLPLAQWQPSFGLCKCTWNSQRLARIESRAQLHPLLWYLSRRANALNCKHAQLTIRHCVCVRASERRARNIRQTGRIINPSFLWKKSRAGDVPRAACWLHTSLKNGNAEWKMRDFLAPALEQHARQSLQMTRDVVCVLITPASLFLRWK